MALLKRSRADPARALFEPDPTTAKPKRRRAHKARDVSDDLELGPAPRPATFFGARRACVSARAAPPPTRGAAAAASAGAALARAARRARTARTRGALQKMLADAAAGRAPGRR